MILLFLRHARRSKPRLGHPAESQPDKKFHLERTRWNQTDANREASYACGIRPISKVGQAPPDASQPEGNRRPKRRSIIACPT